MRQRDEEEPTLFSPDVLIKQRSKMDENQKGGSVHRSCEVVGTFHDCDSEIRTPLADDSRTDPVWIFFVALRFFRPIGHRKDPDDEKLGTTLFILAAPGRIEVAMGSRLILSIWRIPLSIGEEKP
jgi:hypothetical protein